MIAQRSTTLKSLLHNSQHQSQVSYNKVKLVQDNLHPQNDQKVYPNEGNVTKTTLENQS